MKSIVICQNCGKNTPEGKFCEHCGASVQTSYAIRQPAPLTEVSPQLPPAVKPRKNPTIAALLSLLPGLGQVYNGQIGKGIGLFFAVAIGYAIFPLLGLIAHCAVIYEGYATAQKMNNSEIS